MINQDLGVLSYLVRCEWLRGNKKKITIGYNSNQSWSSAWALTQSERWRNSEMKTKKWKEKTLVWVGSGWRHSAKSTGVCLIWYVTHNSVWHNMWVWVKESVIVWRLIQKWHSTMRTHILTRILYTQWRSLWWDKFTLLAWTQLSTVQIVQVLQWVIIQKIRLSLTHSTATF